LGQNTAMNAPAAIPLVLDLDGTVVRSDTLVESLLRLLAARPLALLAVLPLAVRDRAAFKHAVAAASGLDPATLPYDAAVLDLAARARGQGRPVYLATAADRVVADAVAAHLGLFDGVFASDGHANLKGGAKAALLVARFGARGFDYAGDSQADIPVWRAAAQAIVVARGARLARAAGLEPVVVGEAASPAQTARLLARAMRVHQWAKNLLVFVPLLAAHAAHGALLFRSCLAFAAFSLCASCVYLLNDLIDLPHDRAHATKCRRPFASGALGLGWAPALAAGLAVLVLAACAALPGRFLAMLALYYACTLSYAFALKRRAVWDVSMLAGLYTLRIFAGAAATAIPISPWLLAFSLFLFFCLAIVKRLTELTLFVRRAGAAVAGRATLAGRGYGAEDLDMLRSMAASSGAMAVLVMALYVNSGEVLPLYRHPAALWALCPILLFWVSRVLMLANRGLIDDDPVVWALRDRVSLGAGLASLAAILAATL
jgi:4-hydroxybenzoate polyprenyltransferase/phosphoserine phosphatase